MPTAPNIICPTLMSHSAGAVLLQYAKNYFKRIVSEDKHLRWMATQMDYPFHQFNGYAQEEELREVVGQVTKWFVDQMGKREIKIEK
ncbi:MAG: hypothetical protein AAF985_15470 [Bacteroidota bacterium]